MRIVPDIPLIAGNCAKPPAADAVTTEELRPLTPPTRGRGRAHRTAAAAGKQRSDDERGEKCVG